MFYVYEWYNKNTGEIFYVGKGCRNRVNCTSQRNKPFTNYIKNNDCSSRIIKHFDNEREAFEFEHKRICELKSINQCCCNLDYGGRGGNHIIWTDEMREYYSKNNVMKSENQRQRMSINNPMKRKEVVEKVKAKRGYKLYIGDKLYNSLTDAAKEYNMTINAIEYWLRTGEDKNGNKCHLVGEEPKTKVYKGMTWQKPITVNGEYYNSIKNAADSLGLKSTAICMALKHNRPLFKKYYCEYVNQQPNHTNTDNSSVGGSTTNG